MLMEQELFAHLPSETIFDILSRLSLRSIALSKCVCKPWLDLLESDDFVNSHLSKSAAALALSMQENRDSYPFKVFELDDELNDLESPNPITKFHFPRKAILDGSANDLIFLINYEVSFDDLYVCNPITREFIELHYHEEFVDSSHFKRVAYGFGASKVSGEYKVVRINYRSDLYRCHVYTLGTGRWRRVEAATASASSLYGSAFVNGILYWKAKDSKRKPWICCFDLETECFSTIWCPPVGSLYFDLVSLRDSLYAVDNSSDDEIVLWLLEECGTEKCWRKEYVIEQHRPNYDEVFGFYTLRPIKFFKNGDILILCDNKYFFRCSTKAKTYQEIPSLAARGRRTLKSLLLTPSFRSLRRSFGMENVISF